MMDVLILGLYRYYRVCIGSKRDNLSNDVGSGR